MGARRRPGEVDAATGGAFRGALASRQSKASPRSWARPGGTGLEPGEHHRSRLGAAREGAIRGRKEALGLCRASSTARGRWPLRICRLQNAHAHLPACHSLSPPPPLQASVTLRKGNKKLVLYDLTVTLSYEGQLAGSTKVVGRRGRGRDNVVVGARRGLLLKLTMWLSGGGCA